MSAMPSVQQRRIVIGAALCAVAFLLVGVRLAQVTLFPAAAVTAKLGNVDPSSRADIVDRNGELMARDLPVYDLYARPHMFTDKQNAARAIARIAGSDSGRLDAIFVGRHPYVLAARRLAPEQRAAIEKLGLLGLEFETTGKRSYPDGPMAAQVIGVTDVDGNGLSGLEMGLNGQLSGRKPGERLVTSLDMRVEFALARTMSAAMTEYRARAAGGLVMDIETGEILGLVSLPNFDPNDRRSASNEAMRNIMTQNVYELGSVFKIFAFAQAIEDGTVDLDEHLTIGDGFKLGKYTIREAEKMPATLAARDVLAQSSNIGTAQIAMRGGPARQQAFLSRLGLLMPAKSELPEVARPLYPKYWGAVENATIAYGHGISVSPLAFAAAAASIVNGGRKVAPTFLKRGKDARGARVISPRTSETMRQLLRYVVTNGTGKKADVPQYGVGGKTGSAEKSGKYGYQEHKLITSFCAVFPIDRPRYLVFVLLDEPHGNAKTLGFALAGYTAAPLAGQIVSRIAPLLGVPMRAKTDSAENS
jgi:cell division protein FtsI (penicillin-binding protein 3)